MRISTDASTASFEALSNDTILEVIEAHVALSDAIEAMESADGSSTAGLHQLAARLRAAMRVHPEYYFGSFALAEAAVQLRDSDSDILAQYDTAAAEAAGAGDAGSAGLAWHNGALVALRRGGGSDAVARLERALYALGPHVSGSIRRTTLAVSASTALSQLRARDGDRRAARIALDVGLSFVPDAPRLLVELAALLARDGDPTAIVLARRAAEAADAAGDAILSSRAHHNIAILSGGAKNIMPYVVVAETTLRTQLRRAKAAAADLLAFPGVTIVAVDDVLKTVTDQTFFAALGIARGGASWERLEAIEDAVIVIMATCAGATLLLQRATDVDGIGAPAPNQLRAIDASCRLAAHGWQPFVQSYFGSGMAPWDPILNAAITMLRGTVFSASGQLAEAPAERNVSGVPTTRRSIDSGTRRARAGRQLHVAIAGYDMRSHATGYLLEGLVRHSAPQMPISIYQYGPIDPFTPVQPRRRSAIHANDTRILTVELDHQRCAAASLLCDNLHLSLSASWHSQLVMTALGIGATQSERYAAVATAVYAVPISATHAMVAAHMRRDVSADRGGLHHNNALVHLLEDVRRPTASQAIADGKYTHAAAACVWCMPLHCRTLYDSSTTRTCTSYVDGSKSALSGREHCALNGRMGEDACKRATDGDSVLNDGVVVLARRAAVDRRFEPQHITPIDVLVDPMANTFGNREMVISMRPARIVVSHMVAATSGLVAVDWFVADPVKAAPEWYTAHLVLPEASNVLLAAAIGGYHYNLSRQHYKHVRLPLQSAFSERLALLPYSYSANYYTCALPLLGARETRNNVQEGIPAQTNEAVTATLTRPTPIELRGAVFDVLSLMSPKTSLANTSNVAFDAANLLRTTTDRGLIDIQTHRSVGSSGGYLREPSKATARNNEHVARIDACDAPSRRVVCFAVAILDKFDPGLLSAWANILARAPCAELWLLGAGIAPLAGINVSSAATSTAFASFARLKFEAAARGIPAGRMRLLPRTDRNAYVTRLAASADIVLDTRVYSGHTTTLDALWVGVPVLTIEGTGVAARVSSSHLQSASGNHDSLAVVLVTRSLLEFETVATELINHPGALAALRRRVLRAATRCAHLHWVLTTRSMRRAYASMWEAKSLIQHQNHGDVVHDLRRRRIRGASLLPHVVIDPDLRRHGACGDNGGSSFAEDDETTSATGRRIAAATTYRQEFDAAEAALIETLGFRAAATTCRARLSI